MFLCANTLALGAMGIFLSTFEYVLFSGWVGGEIVSPCCQPGSFEKFVLLVLYMLWPLVQSSILFVCIKVTQHFLFCGHLFLVM